MGVKKMKNKIGKESKYGKFDRRNQPVVRFNTDELTKKNLFKLASLKDVSLNIYLEELVKREIIKELLLEKIV